jgi:hypothetical protein
MGGTPGDRLPAERVSDTPGDLHQQVEEFGRETAGLLSATLPNLPVPPVDILVHDNRSIIRPPDRKSLPLYAGGQHLADMKISIACQLDSSGQYLAVEESTFDLLAILDRAPVLRIHYRRDQGARPSAHVHVHGHRGALSHLLSQAGHEHPHDMASLHIPVGGSRYRPCLEDFIQFLICECNFDSVPDWRTHVEERARALALPSGRCRHTRCARGGRQGAPRDGLYDSGARLAARAKGRCPSQLVGQSCRRSSEQLAAMAT